MNLGWVLPAEKLQQRPSAKDGISLEVEQNLRSHGCEIIQEACYLLSLPHVAACTGQAFLQRFYFRKSLLRHDVRDIAAACLFTAAKYEECIKCNGRDIRHFCNVLNDMIQRRDGLSRTPLVANSRRAGEMKNRIVKAERYLLRELGFVLNVTHPHNFLPNFLKVVDSDGTHKHLRQCAWSLCNDSLRTELCVRILPENIACGAIQLAADHLGLGLPDDPPWWDLFGCPDADVEEFCKTMVELYNRPPPTYRDLRSEFEARGSLRTTGSDVTTTTRAVGVRGEQGSSGRLARRSEVGGGGTQPKPEGGVPISATARDGGQRVEREGSPGHDRRVKVRREGSDNDVTARRERRPDVRHERVGGGRMYHVKGGSDKRDVGSRPRSRSPGLSRDERRRDTNRARELARDRRGSTDRHGVYGNHGGDYRERRREPPHR